MQFSKLLSCSLGLQGLQRCIHARTYVTHRSRGQYSLRWYHLWTFVDKRPWHSSSKYRLRCPHKRWQSLESYSPSSSIILFTAAKLQIKSEITSKTEKKVWSSSYLKTPQHPPNTHLYRLLDLEIGLDGKAELIDENLLEGWDVVLFVEQQHSLFVAKESAHKSSEIGSNMQENELISFEKWADL